MVVLLSKKALKKNYITKQVTMTNMKKYLFLVLCAGLFAGCNGGANDNGSTTDSQISVQGDTLVVPPTSTIAARLVCDTVGVQLRRHPHHLGRGESHPLIVCRGFSSFFGTCGAFAGAYRAESEGRHPTVRNLLVGLFRSGETASSNQVGA